MTWREAIDTAQAQFEAAKLGAARESALYLAAHVLRVWKASEVAEHVADSLSSSQTQTFIALVERRLLGEPIQYIVGETEFFGLRLRVTPAVLIPRPDTEILVEEALKEAAELASDGRPLNILDIGTGSGAIALALAHALPDAMFSGIDISRDAVEVAESNRVKLGIENVRFHQRDLLQLSHHELATVTLLVSNPPYIAVDEWQMLEAEVRDHEPRIALTDDSDGYSFYRAIGSLATFLPPETPVVLELGYASAREVERIMAMNGVEHVRTVKDLGGIERAYVGWTL